MAQRKQLSWTALRVGLFVLVGIFVLAVGIFYVTGGSGLARKYRLRTYLPEVEGLTIGAPVRLDGIEIGNVDAIKVAPVSAQQPADRSRSIELVLRINHKYQNDVRTDSYATLITEGLLGNRYVSIHRGFTGVPLQNGQEVTGREESSLKQITERGAEVAENLKVMSEQVREVVEGIQRGRGTLGKLLTDEEAYDRVNSTLARMESLVAGVQEGKGSLGKVVASDELYNKINSSAARVETIIADVQGQKGTLGKFIYDPAIHDNAKEFLDKGNALVADVRAGKGTLGKLANDEELYNKWREAGVNVEKATQQLTQNQSTAGKFFNDPKFYDNLTGLAGDLRLLMGEFRQNPKKFLRVKFSIF